MRLDTRRFLWAVLALFASGAGASGQTQRCLPCHKQEVERFGGSAMGRSLSLPSLEPSGEFEHKPSGSAVQITWKDGTLHHRIVERGLSADYPMAYAIGAGEVGKSYVIDLGGHLFQSPAAYYTKTAEWNAAPGYEDSRVLDFTRAITSDCLVCHAGSMKESAGKQNAGHVELSAISCERCHGSVENHLRNPVPGSIINPAKLAMRERDSVCEQCHLEGATVVLNPGKDWWDFHPGQALEQVETHYVYRTVNGEQVSIAAVSQAEQLSLSACLRGSGGKLWCGTCHNPHGEPANRKEQMKQICGSCHSPGQLAQTHKPEEQDCVSCHMPSRKAVDISHAAVTDHRISKRPGSGLKQGGEKVMVAWQAAQPEFSERDLGLAFFNVARKQGSVIDFQHSFSLLSKVRASEKDAAVEAARGYMLLGSGHAEAAMECFRSSVQTSPDSAEYWLDLGVAEQAAGKWQEAIGAFRNSMDRNPYDFRAYQALATLYKESGQVEQSRATVSDFIRHVPQSLSMRLVPEAQK